MTNSETWIQAYLEGYELECSYDKKKWFTVTEEPTVGNNLYYRVKPNQSYYDPIHDILKKHSKESI